MPLYPYNFRPSLHGLNPEEVFVVMPFGTSHDDVFTALVKPAVAETAKRLRRTLAAYRTKDDPRTISGWHEVLEHLYPAQVVLGVLTKEINANVYYELGIAHATQQLRRQVLIAEEQYEPQFDTKDLIFMRYSPSDPAASVYELSTRVEAALREWDIELETLVKHAIARISPIDFEVIMLWGQRSPNFALRTSAGGPADYETAVSVVHGGDQRFMNGVFERHCAAIGRLQEVGLLGLETHADSGQIQFSYWWTDLGNLVLVKFGRIDDAERQRRYQVMPRHLRRTS